MSEQEKKKVHTYAVKLWIAADGWHAKVLRNEMLWSLEEKFPSKAAAMEWAEEEVRKYREAEDAEAKAEVIDL